MPQICLALVETEDCHLDLTVSVPKVSCYFVHEVSSGVVMTARHPGSKDPELNCVILQEKFLDATIWSRF